MASTVLPNGIIIPEKYSRDWYNDLYHNWQELDNLLGGGTPKDGTLTIQKNGTTVGTFSANQATDETINIEVPDVNNGTLTIQQNGTTVDTFTANSSSDKTVNISVPTKTSDLTNDSGYITGVSWNDVSNKPSFATVATSGSYNDLSNKPTIPTTLESLSTNSIPFHNAYPRCKYLGTSITDAQNTAIKNRTYDDLFIGDYWTINGVNWRIVAIDYYYNYLGTTITDAQNTAIKNRTYDDLFIGDYWTINGVNWRIVAIDYYFNVGDTNFDKGNIIVMPDTVLYSAQMNETDTTAGAYSGSLMRTQNLNNARTIAQNAFGSHLANHRILLANSADTSGPNNWSWYDSDGVELPNEVQIYGTRVWGSALKGYDVATQKQQFPLMALAPQFVNIRQTYWLQDVSSLFVSNFFALVYSDGTAGYLGASNSYGVRPSVTLSYI